MAFPAGERICGKFGLNARRRRCSKSRARARSNKRGSSERQPNGRDAKNGSLTGNRSRRRGWVTSPAMVDPPRQLLVSRVNERRVDRGAVLNNARTPRIAVDQSAVITQARRAGGRNQKL